MGGRGILKEKLQNFLQSKKNSNNNGKSPFKKTSYLIVIALIGLLLIIIANIFTSSTSKEMEENQHLNSQSEQPLKGEMAEADEVSTIEDVDNLETGYEKALQVMLDKIQGVSEVEVMVNLDSTNVKIYEKNLILGQQSTNESDKNGGIRKVEDSTEETQVVLVRQGDQEVPLLVQTKKPEVRGVFVVAKGVDHATVKKWVIEAIARVLDVPTHRVSVMPKN